MMKKIYQFLSVVTILAMGLLLFNSCTNKKSAERIAVEKEMLSLKKSLPISTGIDGLIITDVEIGNDIIIYTMNVTKATWETLNISEDVATSEKNKARVLNNLDSNTIDGLISARLGMEYNYKIEGGDNIKISISADEVRTIRSKVKNGELEPYTLLEITQMEFDRMSFPLDLGNGLMWTNGYIRDNGIYYIYDSSEDINDMGFNSENIDFLRQTLLDDMKTNGIFASHKVEILREKIHFIYQYNFSNGKQTASFDINGDEIFN